MNLDSEPIRSPDEGLLIWVLIWTFVSTAMIIGMVTAGNYDPSNYASSLAMGTALGALSAAWTGWGLYAFVFDLSDRENTSSRQLGIRVGGAFVWVLNLAILLYFAESKIPNLGLAIFLSAVSLTGALLVRALTKRRISRHQTGGKIQTSIAQLFVLTTIIAILLSLINLVFRYFDLHIEFAAIVVLHSAIWLFCVIFLLGRHWWAYSLCVFLQVMLMLWMTDYVDVLTHTLTVQSQLQCNGLLASSFVVSTLFILMVRSSGHQWFMPKWSDPKIPSAS